MRNPMTGLTGARDAARVTNPPGEGHPLGGLAQEAVVRVVWGILGMRLRALALFTRFPPPENRPYVPTPFRVFQFVCRQFVSSFSCIVLSFLCVFW